MPQAENGRRAAIPRAPKGDRGRVKVLKGSGDRRVGQALAPAKNGGRGVSGPGGRIETWTVVETGRSVVDWTIVERAAPAELERLARELGAAARESLDRTIAASTTLVPARISGLPSTTFVDGKLRPELRRRDRANRIFPIEWPP